MIMYVKRRGTCSRHSRSLVSRGSECNVPIDDPTSIPSARTSQHSVDKDAFDGPADLDHACSKFFLTNACKVEESLMVAAVPQPSYPRHNVQIWCIQALKVFLKSTHASGMVSENNTLPSQHNTMWRKKRSAQGAKINQELIKTRNKPKHIYK